MLTNDDEICTPTLSSILLAVQYSYSPQLPGGPENSATTISNQSIFQTVLNVKIMFTGLATIDQCHGSDYVAPVKKISNGSWIDRTTNEIVNLDQMWGQEQPNGGNLQNCTTYRKEDAAFADDSCSYEECFVCAWNREPIFQLRYRSIII